MKKSALYLFLIGYGLFNHGSQAITSKNHGGVPTPNGAEGDRQFMRSLLCYRMKTRFLCRKRDNLIGLAIVKRLGEKACDDAQNNKMVGNKLLVALEKTIEAHPFIEDFIRS